VVAAIDSELLTLAASDFYDVTAAFPALRAELESVAERRAAPTRSNCAAEALHTWDPNPRDAMRGGVNVAACRDRGDGKVPINWCFARGTAGQRDRDPRRPRRLVVRAALRDEEVDVLALHVAICGQRVVHPRGLGEPVVVRARVEVKPEPARGWSIARPAR